LLRAKSLGILGHEPVHRRRLGVGAGTEDVAEQVSFGEDADELAAVDHEHAADVMLLHLPDDVADRGGAVRAHGVGGLQHGDRLAQKPVAQAARRPLFFFEVFQVFFGFRKHARHARPSAPPESTTGARDESNLASESGI
jgi:hypothetical protein